MLPTLNHVRISDTPSSQVARILQNETSVQAGGTYVALGFLGMQDAIVLVDSEGIVINLPYDEESFELE